MPTFYQMVARGLLLILGYRTRLVALVLLAFAITLVVVATHQHRDIE